MPHLHEKIDFTVTIYIVNEGKVLLHLHKKLNKWLAPGGHVELNEDPVECALREAEEETGFKIALVGGSQLPELAGDASDLTPPRFLNRHHISDQHEHVDLGYFARVVGGEEKGEEGAVLRWFNLAELESNEIGLLPTTRAYALAALKEVVFA